MEYVLEFRSGNDVFTLDSFAHYFKMRSFYRYHDGRAEYENPDTGVIFSFEWRLEERVSAWHGEFYPVLFSMSFNRPSFFAYEAAGEIQHFVETNSLEVRENADGTGLCGRFDRNTFIQNWKNGNRDVIQTVENFRREQNPNRTTGFFLAGPFLSSDVLMHLWRWNFGREKLRNEVGYANEVPKMEVVCWNGAFHTCVSWTDAVPCVIPPVDVVLMTRIALAPRKFFFIPTNDVIPLPWAEVQPFFSLCSVEKIGDAFFVHYNSRTVPKALAQAFRALKPQNEALQTVPLSALIDSENRR